MPEARAGEEEEVSKGGEHQQIEHGVGEEVRRKDRPAYNTAHA